MADVIPLRNTVSEPWGGFFPADCLPPPPRQWLVDDIVPCNTVIMLAGAPKRGKSLLLQQMLTSAALGLPWLGKHTEKVRAVGLFMEDDKDELVRRQYNICQAYGRCVGDLEDTLELNPREQLPTRLFEYKRGNPTPIPTALWDRLWQTVDEGRISLIGLDTATLVFGGNAIINIEKVTNSLREITNKCAHKGISVVITVHTNKADPSGFFGPNAWLGTVRAAMNLNIAFDDDLRQACLRERVLTDLGGNYGIWEPIRLVWREGVWEPKDATHSINRPRSTEERAEFNGRVLAFLRQAVRRQMVFPYDDRDPDSLSRYLHRRERLAQNDLNTAVEWMLQHRFATLVKVGRKVAIRPIELTYEGEQSLGAEAAE